MASSPLVIWRLTDGKPGHMQQTLGLARALSALTSCATMDIDVSAGGANLLDIALGRFRPGQGRPSPELILGAGHGTHLALLAARRAAGGKAVALMKPSLPLSLFDFVVVPEHDGVAPGPRVIPTLGVLNPMQPGAKETGSLLFLIGGPSKHVQWDDGVILQQLQAIVATLPSSCRWRVADSRRTPAALSAALQQRYGERFQPWPTCPPGWLAQQLAITESVWVSADSVSMVYEALTAACRVGLLEVPRRDKPGRVMRGVEQLAARGMVTPFSAWSDTKALAAPLHFNEAERVARWLLDRLPRGAA